MKKLRASEPYKFFQFSANFLIPALYLCSYESATSSKQGFIRPIPSLCFCSSVLLSNSPGKLPILWENLHWPHVMGEAWSTLAGQDEYTILGRNLHVVCDWKIIPSVPG